VGNGSMSVLPTVVQCRELSLLFAVIRLSGMKDKL